MGIRDFARSLRPGNDQQLATDLSQQRRRNHRRHIPGAAAASDRWEQADRQRDKRGGWRRTDWN